MAIRFALLCVFAAFLFASPALCQGPFTNEANSANVIINLDVHVASRHVETNPFEAELVVVITSYMQLTASEVKVVKVSVNEEASVILCTGDIAGFANAVNAGDPFFDGTILQGATISTIFWGVECVDPLSNLPSDSRWGGDDDGTSDWYITSPRFVPSPSADSPGGDNDSNSASVLATASAALLLLAATLI